VSVVDGNLEDPPAILQQLPSIWGISSAQVKSDAEEKQGKAIYDAAVANAVQHCVYSPLDPWGPDRSAKHPTPVKTFTTKLNVEEHLEKAAAASPQSMTYTVLRPVTFVENEVPGKHERGFARMSEHSDKRLLLMFSTKDRGWSAAQAFLQSEDHRNRASTLAGDEFKELPSSSRSREV
jgi:hypothetical protein